MTCLTELPYYMLVAQNVFQLFRHQSQLLLEIHLEILERDVQDFHPDQISSNCSSVGDYQNIHPRLKLHFLSIPKNRLFTGLIDRLRVVHSQVILILKSMSERVGSGIERL